MNRQIQIVSMFVAVLLTWLTLPAPVAWGACGSISGTISDVLGPLGDVDVKVYHQNHTLIGSTTTNWEDGTYTVGGLPPGSYKVEFDTRYASGSPNGYLPQWYNAKGGFSAATPVTVSSGADTPGIDATLAEGGSISGTVTGTTAPGINGVTVTAFDPTGTAVGSTTTELDGTYSITALPTGSYMVRFSRDATACSGVIWYQARTDISSADPVPVTVGYPTTGIDAHFPTATIRGTVTNGTMPLYFAFVTVYDAVGGAIVDSANTNASGYYEFADLPPGSYKIKYGSPPPAYSPTQYVTTWYKNRYSKVTADIVTVVDGAVVTADAIMEQGGSIKGTVTDSVTHAPLSSVAVYAYDSVTGDLAAATITDLSVTVTYTLQGLRPGSSYQIQFITSQYVTQWYRNKVSQAAADPVAVPALTPPVTGIDAALVPAGGNCPGAGSVTGRAVDPCGSPLPFALVTAYDAGGMTASTGYSDQSGNVVMACLPSGTYTIVVSTEGYVVSSAATVTAPNATNLGDVTLGIGGSISGRVTDASGKGVANASVTILNAAGAAVGQGALTDSSGQYVAGGLPSGRYRIYATYDGCNGLESGWFDNHTEVPVTAPGGASGIDITFGGAAPSPHVMVQVVGTGSGAVNSTPPNTDCVSGATCANSYQLNQVVTLTPHPDTGSVFAGWNGGGCAGMGVCTVTVSATMTVTATFTAATVKRDPSTYFLTLAGAYATAADGGTIRAVARSFGESLTFDRGIGISLVGGYTADFSGIAGTTTVQPPFIVKAGKVTVANVVIK